jgi:hypothetical protein
MSNLLLGLGPNLHAYQSALQNRSESQQMSQTARLVAQTLSTAFQNVPYPVGSPKTRRERDLLRLREAIEQMVLALTTAVKEGGFDELVWSDIADHLQRNVPQRSSKQKSDEVSLSVASRQFQSKDPVVLDAVERSLHPLEDSKTAEDIAWLAQAQLLHEAILAFDAQANIDTELAQKVLNLTQPKAVSITLAQRAEHMQIDPNAPSLLDLENLAAPVNPYSNLMKESDE